MQPLHSPASTYRLQFNRDFGFADAHRIVPYLNRLGITDLYASPLFQAREGSSHGYDVVDPTRLNPQLGAETEFRLLAGELENRDMGFFLDIVPNHMATSDRNPWWRDVLENGRCSPYSGFFDIDWDQKGLENRILLPFVGKDREAVLENGEFALDLADAGVFLYYYEHRFPLDIRSCRLVLTAIVSSGQAGTEVNSGISGVIDKMTHLAPVIQLAPEDNRAYWQRQEVKKEFLNLVRSSPDTRSALQEALGEFFEEQNRDTARQLLDEQVYRLEYWKRGLTAVNYRRFFDISELIGLRTENPEVFEATHPLILQLAAKGDITGIRVDHIDGLLDPQAYLARLRSALAERTNSGANRPFYGLVEKILSGNERLSSDWATFGTTGYDFLNALNRVCVDPTGARLLKQFYAEFTGEAAEFTDIVYAKKKQVIGELFAAEVSRLARSFLSLPGVFPHDRDITEESIAHAITEVSACLPVYRTYITRERISRADRQYIRQAIDEAVARNTDCPLPAIDLLERVLLLQYPDNSTDVDHAEWAGWVMRWQQFTGPAMAKGFEDTALYSYHYLISLNEVGGDPGVPDLAPSVLHRHNLMAQQDWPFTMNATSTHDTKRSEDVRSRIDVLSEMPVSWTECVNRWHKMNRAKKRFVDGTLVPEPEMEMLIYQTLIGAWPLDSGEIHDFEDRFKAYLLKAAREAKVRSHWHAPDSDYEQALQDFVSAILADTSTRGFLKGLIDFQKGVAFYGAINSLSQVLLKIASPGVPDFYQGTELWDFSLVDPDNRRPVDFQYRENLLGDLMRDVNQDNLSLIEGLMASWPDGRIKMFVTHRALQARKADPELFCSGEYMPLYAAEEKDPHILAFVRKYGDQWLVAIVPRLVSQFTKPEEWPLGKEILGDDVVIVPDGFPEEMRNVFTGEVLKTEPGHLPLAQVFARFPVALLRAD